MYIKKLKMTNVTIGLIHFKIRIKVKYGQVNWDSGSIIIDETLKVC